MHIVTIVSFHKYHNSVLRRERTYFNSQYLCSCEVSVAKTEHLIYHCIQLTYIILPNEFTLAKPRPTMWSVHLINDVTATFCTDTCWIKRRFAMTALQLYMPIVTHALWVWFKIWLSNHFLSLNVERSWSRGIMCFVFWFDMCLV